MTQDLIGTLTASGAPPRQFWESDLEMPFEHILSGVAADSKIGDWLSRLTGRQAAVLHRHLGLKQARSVQATKKQLQARDGDLLPFYLVHQFSMFKSQVATADFAGAVLGADVMELCRKNEEEFDKPALCFAIYHHDPTNLRLLFHLDKIHKTGFARMKLKKRIRRPKRSFKDFLTVETVAPILAEFDASKRDGRTSELKSVLQHDGRFLVFVRRAERPDFIVRPSGVIHGYRPEWIILDFIDEANRVNISSVSVSVPLEIANKIATVFFGKPCEYDNESQITYAMQIVHFLRQAKDGKADQVPLVEVIVRNSPLNGCPKVKITDEDASSVRDGINHFETAIGPILSDVEQIDSVKLGYRGKRVNLNFEKNDGSDDEYVVRYSDHRLNALERRSFEEHLRNTHGIPVLSTEKRFKNTA